MDSSSLTLLLYASFPLLCIAVIRPTRRKGSIAERLVFGLALYEFLLFAIGTSLGLMHKLTAQAYGAATSGLAFFLLLLAWRNRTKIDFPRTRWFQTRRGAAVLLLLALLTMVFSVQVGFESLYGTRHYDGLWYHIPRAMFWIQQQSFDAWPTPSWAQIGLPVGADVILCQKILLGEGWIGTSFVTCLLSVGAVACVYLAALDMRLTRWQALMAAILFGSFPVIGMRIWTVNSDIAAAFPVLAAYVALRRIRNIGSGLTVFFLLNGLAIACKPTVAPHAAILGGIGLWQCRHRITAHRSFGQPCIAAFLAVLVVLSSYLPVYNAFHDFQGGDGGRHHKVRSVTEFAQAAAMSAVNWVAEPLGYFNPDKGSVINEITNPIYCALGGDLSDCPDAWIPSPNQDTGRSGLASVLMLPVLITGFAPRIRYLISFLFFSGFITLSGMVHFKPWNARYTVILLAGYALLWAGAKFFRRGNRRWLIVGLVGLNICALTGITGIVIFKDRTVHSQPDGLYSYIDGHDRKLIAKSLGGRPLLVVSQESLVALLVGPDIDFHLKYVTRPRNGDWGLEFRNAATQSSWLAIVHRGAKSMLPGSNWHRPGATPCPPVSTQALEDALIQAGWKLYKSNHALDLWTRLAEV